MFNWNKKEAPILGLQGSGGGLGYLAGAGSLPTYIIEIFGGGGGSGATNSSGGSGGYSKVEINLIPGTYYVTAGVKGYNGVSSGARARSAGGNGLRQKQTDQGGSGGGFSAIWANNSYTGNPILLVGGAGGSDWGDMGGDGGGVNQNGGTGWDNHNNAAEYRPNSRPIGATLTAGGYYNHTYSSTSPTCDGEAGVAFRGGDTTCTDTYSGGGGGGGYYGGGAGTGNVGNGGTPGSGGSGYADTSNYDITIITNTSPSQRDRTFNPASHSMYWQPNNPGASLGSGNWGGGGTMASDGQHGRVRIYAKDGTTLLHDITGAATNTAVTLT